MKNCRYALWKNPEDLTARQAAKLAWIARHNHQLYRAYLLKEQLRLVFQHRGDEAVAMLDAWLAWARRSQIPAFVELYHRINKHRAGIIAAVTHGLSNGLTESVIIWSTHRGVVDVADEGAGTGGGRVLWSLSLRSTMSRAA